jgi:hypothetical protein
MRKEVTVIRFKVLPEEMREIMEISIQRLSVF